MSYTNRSHPLEYAIRSRALSSFRWKRRAIMLLIAASVCFALARIVPRARHYLSAVAHERAAVTVCLNYSPHATQLVFDDSIRRRSAAFYPAGSTLSGEGRPIYRASRAAPTTASPETGRGWDEMPD